MGDNGRIDKENAFGGYANFLTTAVIFTREFSLIPTTLISKHLTYFLFSAVPLLIPENNILFLSGLKR